MQKRWLWQALGRSRSRACASSASHGSFPWMERSRCFSQQQNPLDVESLDSSFTWKNSSDIDNDTKSSRASATTSLSSSSSLPTTAEANNHKNNSNKQFAKPSRAGTARLLYEKAQQLHSLHAKLASRTDCNNNSKINKNKNSYNDVHAIGNLDLYTLYTRALYANLGDHEPSTRGLVNAMQISAWMRAKALDLPPKAWSRVVLAMMYHEYPMALIMEWIQSQKVSDLRAEMTFVFASTLDRLKKPHMVLEFLEQYVDKMADLEAIAQEEQQQMQTQDQDQESKPLAGLLRFLLPKFLAVHPTIDQVERYLAVLSLERVDVGWRLSESVVRYLLNPSNHARGGNRALRTIVGRLMACMQSNPEVLRWHTGTRNNNRENGTRAVSFYDVLTQSLNELDDEQDREIYVMITYGHARDPKLLFELARERSMHDKVLFTDCDVYNAAVVANMDDQVDPRDGLANAIEMSSWMRQETDFVLAPSVWANVLLKMIEQKYSLDEMVEWMDAQPVPGMAHLVEYALSEALNQSNTNTDVVLGLLKHYLFHNGIHEPTSKRGDLLSHLLDKFLKAKPSLSQLKEFVTCFRSTRRVLSRDQCQRVVTQYLQLESNCSVESSLELIHFLKQHAQVLKRLDLRESSSQIGVWVGSGGGKEAVQAAKLFLDEVFVSNRKRRREFAQAVVQQLLDEDSDAEALSLFRELMQSLIATTSKR